MEQSGNITSQNRAYLSIGIFIFEKKLPSNYLIMFKLKNLAVLYTLTILLYIYILIYFNISNITRTVLLEAVFSTLIIVICVQFNFSARILGKNKGKYIYYTKIGKIPLWSYLFFWNFYLWSYLTLYFFDKIKRIFAPLTNVTRINENFYLGGIFSLDELSIEEKKELTYIIDMTSEYNSLKNYNSIVLNYPTFDAKAPALEVIY
jgi:hypothetical protein